MTTSKAAISKHLISLEKGALVVTQRRIFKESPVAGVSVENISPPPGLLIGAVIRDKKVFLPGPKERIEAGDRVVLLAHQSQQAMIQILFPGPEDK